MSAYSILLWLHGGLGTLALVTFWLAGLSRKGSPVHRRAGQVYLLAMAALLLPAIPLAVRVLVTQSQVFGAFLLYLVVLAATSIWTSWRAIRDKHDWARYVGPVYRSLAIANLAGGAAMLAVALSVAEHAQLVLVAFSSLGLINFVTMRRFAQRAPTDTRWWLSQHMGSMIGNGVATHIAFLAIGLPRLLPMLDGPTLRSLAWLGPLLAAGIAGLYLRRKYLSTRRASPLAASP